MSQQMEFLKHVISSVQSGSLDATDLLRQICQSVIEGAPVHALIVISQCLLKLGEEESDK
jgi:hypothetical protein